MGSVMDPMSVREEVGSLTETENKPEVERESQFQLVLHGAFMWTQKPITGFLGLSNTVIAGGLSCAL